jgi:hypothetical protein
MVQNGGGVAAFDGPGGAWRFENGTGTVAFETRSGNHADIRGGQWTENGSAIRLRPTEKVVTGGADLNVDAAESFSLSAQFRTNSSADYREELPYPRIALHGNVTAFGNTDGYQIALDRGVLLAALGDGRDTVVLRGPRVDDATWHNATVRRSADTVKLILDGRVVDSTTWEGEIAVDGRPFRIGRGFYGSVRSVTVDVSKNNSVKDGQPARHGRGELVGAVQPDIRIYTDCCRSRLQ